ncbi:MAG TPA: response regulator, partial [Terriglobales bacterium]|nr:response regulator [Terriglobales bacterium]
MTAIKNSGDPQQTNQDLKILVADDSAIYRKLVEHTLADDNYNVIFAKNGREALDLYAKHTPALVITDWTMPDISGLELCQKIRKDF